MKILTKEEVIEKCLLKGKVLKVSEEVYGEIKERAREGLKRLIESMLEEEVKREIGARGWERNRRRKNYRNGRYRRGLITGLGEIKDLEVPRVRKGGIKFKTIPRYRRRSRDVEKMIIEMFLAGVSTRRVKEVIKPLMGRKVISSQTVSNLAKELDRMVEEYHSREIEDRFKYLILDGIYLKVKSPIEVRSRCILVAYGIKEDGSRELIDYQLASKGESEGAWYKFLSSLYMRGLEGKRLKIITIDGNKGLRRAVELVYPVAKIQRCWVHKIRNVRAKIKKKDEEECMKGVKEIYLAENYNHAVYRFRIWKKKWKNKYSQAVKCIEEDLEELLAFFGTDEKDRIKIRTTNIIERVFREIRRRTRPMSCFQNKKSVDRIIFAIFYRFNCLWRNSPYEITQNY